MNRNQRYKNRATARALRGNWLSRQVCENCGGLGAHWINVGVTLDKIIARSFGDVSAFMNEPILEAGGFWTCPVLYGTDGRRLPEHEGVGELHDRT